MCPYILLDRQHTEISHGTCAFPGFFSIANILSALWGQFKLIQNRKWPFLENSAPRKNGIQSYELSTTINGSRDMFTLSLFFVVCDDDIPSPAWDLSLSRTSTGLRWRNLTLRASFWDRSPTYPLRHTGWWLWEDKLSAYPLICNRQVIIELKSYLTARRGLDHDGCRSRLVYLMLNELDSGERSLSDYFFVLLHRSVWSYLRLWLRGFGQRIRSFRPILFSR